MSFATPWTVACQDPLSMGFPRQEYWSGLPLANPEDLPSLRIEPAYPALASAVFTTEPRGKPIGGYSLLLIRYCLKPKKYAISTYLHGKLLPTLTIRSESQNPNKISKVNPTLPICLPPSPSHSVSICLVSASASLLLLCKQADLYHLSRFLMRVFNI